MKKTAFIVFYDKDTIFSLNAVVAALETDRSTRQIAIFYIYELRELMAKLQRILNVYELIVVGFSLFLTQIGEIIKVIKKIRKRFGNRIIIIAGGPHPSARPKETLKIGFDAVFIGESEKTVIKYFKRLQNNKNVDKVKGMACFNQNGSYCYTKKDYTINLDQYPPFPVKNTRFGAIEIGRGCPYACNFCQASFMMGTKTRYRSIETICKYVEILKKEFKEDTDIRFIIPNAFSYGSKDGKSINLPKLDELLSRVKGIIEAQGRIFYGTFPSEVRPEHINDETLALLKKYADNDNIIIGAQSGSQKMLDHCHRGHTIHDIYTAVELTSKFGLLPNVDFIFGLPGEEEQDKIQTRECMKDLISMGARIHAHFFIPLPGTPFAGASVRNIDKETRKFLKKYNYKGKVYGNWRKQEKIVKYLN